MCALKCPDEVLHFTNYMSIEISYANAVSYFKCKSYDDKLMNQGFMWHQISVIHSGRSHGVDGKNEILQALYEIAEGDEFYPVAYRRGRLEDRFLVRQCQPALERLFAQNLRIVLPKGEIFYLQVQLNVAEFKYGQISPINQISKALNKLYDRMEQLNGESGILNLSRFDHNSELFDIIVNLGNRGVLERVCDLIYRNDERFRTINGIILSDNGISTMSPFKLFVGVEFAILDLRNNNLQSYIRLNRDLESIKADELMLLGNPITQSPTYPECLKPIFKNFKMLDGVPTDHLSQDYRPSVSNVAGQEAGCRIDWSNKGAIDKFEKSTDWHSFMIPDAEQSFSKEEIMDYFFLGVSPTLSEIYPCYYKYANGEHQFLVRQCFDQIKFLVENCNLEIKIPRFEAPPPPTEFTTDYAPQLVMDTTLVYYIRMNTSPFKKGQLEPLECIEKALNRRFSAMDRMLNLDNFQSIEGLENIVVNLSSPKILTRVLMQATRKFLTTCVEFRLAHNKIVSMNYPKILQLMTNLKAIDLGNNWLHELDDVKQLSMLNIKSLRLDGNPLCSKYSFAGEYIRDIKKHFTELTKLDGIEITTKNNLSSPKNFLCDVAGYDLVNEFITRFFNAFENNRACLKDLYSHKAIVSLTCNYNVAKLTTQNMKRIAKYSDHARNLWNAPDRSQLITSTYNGHRQIQRLFANLPNVTFDMLTFCTDCTIFQENMIVINVNGVYLDQAPSIVETDILMAFSRIFVLKQYKRKTGSLKCATLYKITNDQLNVYNPTPAQTKMAFKYFKNMSIPNDDLTVSDKEALLVMLQEATCLKTIWCTRCLEEADWNFQKALGIFVKLCERKEIPDAALIDESLPGRSTTHQIFTLSQLMEKIREKPIDTYHLFVDYKDAPIQTKLNEAMPNLGSRFTF